MSNKIGAFPIACMGKDQEDASSFSLRFHILHLCLSELPLKNCLKDIFNIIFAKAYSSCYNSNIPLITILLLFFSFAKGLVFFCAQQHQDVQKFCIIVIKCMPTVLEQLMNSFVGLFPQSNEDITSFALPPLGTA